MAFVALIKMTISELSSARELFFMRIQDYLTSVSSLREF
jgi:hypothetical protein